MTPTDGPAHRAPQGHRRLTADPGMLDAGPDGWSNLAILAFLLAIAALAHQTSKLTLVSSLPTVLVSGSAVLLLARPFWAPLLLLFAASQLWMLVGHDPPAVDNHWWLIGCVNAGLLCSAASAARRDGAVPWRVAQLEPFALPLVRGCVLILYGLSVLHKLNAAFLDPGVSCATELYAVLARRFPLPASAWLPGLAIHATLVSEVAIPALLASRRLRTVGILYGLAFHYVLGLAGFQNFSLTMVALYAAFLPAGFGRELARLRASVVRGRRLLGWAASLLGLWLLIFLAVVAALAARGLARDPRWLVHAGWYALWMVCGPLLAAGYIVVTARLARDADPTSDRIAPRRAWHAVTFGLLLVNGLSPYLGLKTEAAFSMYSNLRTEGSHWNHLLLPSWLRLDWYQDDLVSIHAASVAPLRRHHEQGEQLVGVEFERLVDRLCREGHRPVAIDYTRNGQRHSVPDACEVSPRTGHPVAWADRLLVFRPVTPACRH